MQSKTALSVQGNVDTSEFFEAARSILFAATVSNFFPYKPISLTNCRLWPLSKNLIGLLSKFEIFKGKLNKKIFLGKQPPPPTTNPNPSPLKKHTHKKPKQTNQMHYEHG